MSPPGPRARVVLLNPPTASASTEILLSLAYLAAALRHAGHEALVLDATAPFAPLSPEAVDEEIRRFRPHVIGVTLTITFIAQTYAYLDRLRAHGIPIVAGGSHVNPLPDEAIAHGVDVVALGEGERTVVELAEHFAGGGGDLSAIAGLCWRGADGALRRTAPRALVENLDDLPFPAFEDFPIRRYTGSDDVDSNPVFWAVFSSRGCPFQCTFCCGYNVFGRTYRLRSAENIVEEIRHLVRDYGVRKIAFQDDEILLDRGRALRLCRLLAESGLALKMSARSRIDSIDDEMILRLREAGLRRISFGIESWNDETLRRIKKNYRVEAIFRGLDVLARVGFPHVHLNAIVGFPWETRALLEANLRALERIPPSIHCFITLGTPIPYPNTELYEEYHERFGFTGWWLDPAKHWDGFLPGEPRPLLLRLARSMSVLYTPELYWNYTETQRRDLEWFVWRVYRLLLRRHLGPVARTLAYAAARASHALWRRSPAWEARLAALVPERFVRQVEGALSFRKME